MGKQLRLNSFSDNKYKYLNVELLSKEDIVSIYNENKELLIKKGFRDIILESNLEVLLNSLMYKDIELAKILIQDLIKLNISYVNLHEIVEISTYRFATKEETQKIFSNQKIFNWFFEEYHKSYMYIRNIHNINKEGYDNIIFKSINNLLWFFVENEYDDQFYQALHKHLNSLPKIEKEIFFDRFARFDEEKHLLNNRQKDIVGNLLNGLNNEQTIKLILNIDIDLDCSMQYKGDISNYNSNINSSIINKILSQRKNINEELFIYDIIRMIEKRNHSDYEMQTYFRNKVSAKYILKYKDLRYSLCENYSLDKDYLPIIPRKKVDNDELNVISYAIKEMIDINCKFQLFDPVNFFDPMGGYYHYDKEIQNVIMQNLYDFAYNKNLEIDILLKVILYYKVDVDKITFKKDIAKDRKNFYNNLNATCEYLMKIFINPSVDSHIAHDLKIERMRMAMHLLSINSPIELLELVLSTTNSNSNDKEKTLMHLFFHILIEQNIENFEPVTNYIIVKNLTEKIIKYFNVDILTKYDPKYENEKKPYFFNRDFIFTVKNYIHSYVTRISATSKQTYTLSFFEKLLERFIVVKESDYMFSKYLDTIKYPCIYEDLDIEALINEIKSDLAKINCGEF